MLDAFLGWPESKVRQWARRWLDEPDPFLLTQNPAWYVTPLLIPETLRVRLTGRDFEDLTVRLRTAIEGGDPNCGFKADQDWTAAKARIERVLIKFGADLPKDRDVPPPVKLPRGFWKGFKGDVEEKGS